MKLSKKILSAALLLVLTAGAALAGDHVFTLYNYSGKTIRKLGLHPSFSPVCPVCNGGEMGNFRGIMRNGTSTEIHYNFDTDRYGEYWDMKIEYTDGTHQSWIQLDILNMNTISVDVKGTIHWNF